METTYHGEKGEKEIYSEFGGIDLNSAVKLPNVNTNVTVDIPNSTWVGLGLALLANVLIFWIMYYFIKKSE